METKAEKKAPVLEELCNELSFNLDRSHCIADDLLIKICKIKDIREPRPDDSDIKQPKVKEPTCLVDLLEQKVCIVHNLNRKLEFIINSLDKLI